MVMNMKTMNTASLKSRQKLADPTSAVMAARPVGVVTGVHVCTVRVGRVLPPVALARSDVLLVHLVLDCLVDQVRARKYLPCARSPQYRVTQCARVSRSMVCARSQHAQWASTHAFRVLRGDTESRSSGPKLRKIERSGTSVGRS
jgi:hypothetical protein